MGNFALFIKLALIGVGVLLVLAAVVVGIGNISFKRAFNGKVGRLFKDQPKAERAVITEEDIKDLPEPVQRFLRYTKVIGKKRVATVRLKQKGFMRPKPDGNWIPLEAEQFFAVDNPGFVWKGSLTMAPLLTMSAQDMYLNGTGNMHVKVMSTITAVNAKGKDMDKASLLRYLSEMSWFPTSFVSDKVKWEPIDAQSARASITDHGITVSGVFTFNDKGELIYFAAERARDVGGGKLVKTKWIADSPVREYRTINGMHIQVKGQASWHLDSGEYTYIKLDLTDIEYDNPTLY
ncbi:MAG TPA: DUF6544 family protein [Candidatus Aquicultor sp.]|jgi:hypothetical protein